MDQATFFAFTNELTKIAMELDPDWWAKLADVTPVGQRVYGQLYNPAAGGGMSMLNMRSRARAAEAPVASTLAAGKQQMSGQLRQFAQGNPEVMSMLRKSPLAQHMPEDALLQNFLMNHKPGRTPMDTARALGLHGGPSEAEIKRRLAEMQGAGTAGPGSTTPGVRPQQAGTAAGRPMAQTAAPPRQMAQTAAPARPAATAAPARAAAQEASTVAPSAKSVAKTVAPPVPKPIAHAPTMALPKPEIKPPMKMTTGLGSKLKSGLKPLTKVLKAVA